MSDAYDTWSPAGADVENDKIGLNPIYQAQNSDSMNLESNQCVGKPETIPLWLAIIKKILNIREPFP
jgi:hypothetical protein